MPKVTDYKNTDIFVAADSGQFFTHEEELRFKRYDTMKEVKKAIDSVKRKKAAARPNYRMEFIELVTTFSGQPKFVTRSFKNTNRVKRPVEISLNNGTTSKAPSFSNAKEFYPKNLSNDVMVEILDVIKTRDAANKKLKQLANRYSLAAVGGASVPHKTYGVGNLTLTECEKYEKELVAAFKALEEHVAKLQEANNAKAESDVKRSA